MVCRVHYIVIFLLCYYKSNTFDGSHQTAAPMVMHTATGEQDQHDDRAHHATTTARESTPYSHNDDAHDHHALEYKNEIDVVLKMRRCDNPTDGLDGSQHSHG